MTSREGVKPQAAALLTLDALESNGKPGRFFHPATRPLLHDALFNTWYSFTIIDPDDIHVGETCRVEVAFANASAAPLAFPANTSARWGNGLVTRGTLVIERWYAVAARR